MATTWSGPGASYRIVPIGSQRFQIIRGLDPSLETSANSDEVISVVGMMNGGVHAHYGRDVCPNRGLLERCCERSDLTPYLVEPKGDTFRISLEVDKCLQDRIPCVRHDDPSIA
jgi:hypothetical protein